MSEPKFTPGPWHVGTMNDALFIINETPRPAPNDSINPALTAKVIAKPSEPHQEGWTFDEYQANANLIAAAPELLAALTDLVEAGEESWGYDRPCLVVARKALAKAEGKNQ